MVFFRPTLLIDGDITDIDLSALAESGVRGLILDLDSTLLAPHSGVLTVDAAKWLIEARQKFKVAVVSNNKRDQYIKDVQKLLDLPVIGRAAKPSVRALRMVQEQFQLAPNEVALIGDRPLTDVWGGQRAGMRTILVWPLKTMNEPGWITMVRKLERVFIKY